MFFLVCQGIDKRVSFYLVKLSHSDSILLTYLFYCYVYVYKIIFYFYFLFLIELLFVFMFVCRCVEPRPTLEGYYLLLLGSSY